jgi:hypothetical protein
MNAWLVDAGTIRRVTEDDVIGALAHYPHLTRSHGWRRLVLKTAEDCGGFNGGITARPVGSNTLEAVKIFIETDLGARVMRRKVTSTGAFFDTDEKRCPFVRRSHGAAKQYFYYQPITKVLFRKCWYGDCQSKSLAVGRFEGLRIVRCQRMDGAIDEESR